ncbi:MAG: hypothetical protein ACO4B4_09090 [Planctomycetota bacterium]|jgi:hypothetical protein
MARTKQMGVRGSRCRIFGLGGLLLLGSLGLGGCGTLTDAQLTELGIEYWDATPGGAISADEVGTVGDRIDVDGTLSLDSEKVWVYRAAALMGPTRLEATLIDLGYNGLSELTEDLDFSGESFLSGDVLASDLDATILQVHSDTGVYDLSLVKFGFIAGLDQLRLDANLSSDGSGGGKGGGGPVSASSSFDEWVPVVGLKAGFSIPLMAVTVFADGKMSGIFEDISLGTIEGDYLSTELRAGVDIDDGFQIGLGFRSIDAKFDDGGDNYDLDLGGGFLFLHMVF